MRKIVVFLAILFISSCDKTTKIAKDGYRFDEKEYEITDNTIEFVIARDEQEFNSLRNQYVGNNSDVQAFGRLRPFENKCILYIKDPSWSYQPEFIGHEVAHCIWGRWHKSDKPDRSTND